MPANLSDLDELVIAVRDADARRHFQEAVACYHAGALRAAVVSAWTSCVYDVLGKTRELALTGDARARQVVEQFEQLRQAADISRALEFERGILDLARDEFELLSPQEHTDLRRLQEDRNRCAHPTMNSAEESYRPSAEMTRYHLHSAGSHLLTRPPVQGRAALTSVFAQVESPYFPETVDEALSVLSQGPLARAKHSLLRNFVVASLKTLTDGTRPVGQSAYRRVQAALAATLRMYPDDRRQLLLDESPRVARAVPDDKLLWLVKLYESFPEMLPFAPHDVVLKLQNYVERLPAEERVIGVVLALDVPPLRNAAVAKASQLTHDELADAVRRARERVIRHPSLIDRAFDLYMNAGSFYEANAIARGVIIPLSEKLSADQVRRILREAGTHRELAGAATTPAVLESIWNAQLLPRQEFHELVSSNDLEPYFGAVTLEQMAG